MRGHQWSDKKIKDVCDGKMYCLHPLFSSDRTVLQIMLYYDDLEVANPIGSRSTKHKLGEKVKFMCFQYNIFFDIILMQVYFTIYLAIFLPSIVHL